MGKVLKYILSLCLQVLLLTSIFLIPIHATTTSGSIDNSHKYAWSENAGWINFGTSQGSVQVTGSALTGYAWGENIGWISLNCINNSSCASVDYKVSNDANGNLSGYAWSENAGWIDFNPAQGGVVINSSGEFSGYAWGENIGWISFNCSNSSSCNSVDYKVKTSWTPSSGESSGGGGIPASFRQPPSPPGSGFAVYINNNANYTDASTVSLTLIAGNDVARMAIANSPELTGIDSTGQIPYQTPFSWDLCRGKNDCSHGKRTVYVKFFTQYGEPSEVVSDSIIYQTNLLDPKYLNRLKEVVPQGIQTHALVKLYNDGDPETQADSAVYYIGDDGMRHAFPNSKAFLTWYIDFSGVHEISMEEMSQLPLGDNVRYRPGVKMVKFTTDPKVYLVTENSVLRWIISEEIASQLYGPNWNKMIDDISDAFYINYSFGDTIDSAADYDLPELILSEVFISDNLQQ